MVSLIQTERNRKTSHNDAKKASIPSDEAFYDTDRPAVQFPLLRDSILARASAIAWRINAEAFDACPSLSGVLSANSI